jgi:hypothetical protein
VSRFITTVRSVDVPNFDDGLGAIRYLDNPNGVTPGSSGIPSRGHRGHPRGLASRTESLGSRAATPPSSSRLQQRRFVCRRAARFLSGRASPILATATRRLRHRHIQPQRAAPAHGTDLAASNPQSSVPAAWLARQLIVIFTEFYGSPLPGTKFRPTRRLSSRG